MSEPAIALGLFAEIHEPFHARDLLRILVGSRSVTATTSTASASFGAIRLSFRLRLGLGFGHRRGGVGGLRVGLGFGFRLTLSLAFGGRGPSRAATTASLGDRVHGLVVVLAQLLLDQVTIDHAGQEVPIRGRIDGTLTPVLGDVGLHDLRVDDQFVENFSLVLVGNLVADVIANVFESEPELRQVIVALPLQSGEVLEAEQGTEVRVRAIGLQDHDIDLATSQRVARPNGLEVGLGNLPGELVLDNPFESGGQFEVKGGKQLTGILEGLVPGTWSFTRGDPFVKRLLILVMNDFDTSIAEVQLPGRKSLDGREVADL